MKKYGKKERKVTKKKDDRFGFSVKWHVNLHGLFNVKAILVEKQLWYYLTHSWVDERFHTFPKVISSKVTGKKNNIGKKESKVTGNKRQKNIVKERKNMVKERK